MTPKKRLGRGLDALLSKPAAAKAAPTESETPLREGDSLRKVPVELLQRGQYQPRVDMRQDTLENLADSIRAQGVVQPIVVRPISGSGGEQRYEIIAGERRWRAAQLAGLQEIPGVGPARKRALLHHFGTLKAIERASITDLAQVSGISSETARRIYDFFHEKQH